MSAAKCLTLFMGRKFITTRGRSVLLGKRARLLPFALAGGRKESVYCQARFSLTPVRRSVTRSDGFF